MGLRCHILGNYRTIRISMTSKNILPRIVLGLRQTTTSQDSPGTVRVTMTSRVVLGQNMTPLDMTPVYSAVKQYNNGIY